MIKISLLVWTIATTAVAAKPLLSQRRTFGRGGLMMRDGDRHPTSTRHNHRTLQTNSSNTGNITNDDLEVFFADVDSEFESENIRGAAYAFRGPGMSEPIMKGFGLTESNDATAEPVDVDTAFMLASISKTYTGAAVAALIDEGYIDGLDDDICDVFGGDTTTTACRNPEYKDVPVTWRMLVTHRSSINENVPDLDGLRTSTYGPDGVNYYQEVVGNPSCPLDDTQQFFEDLFVQKETETTVGNLGGHSVNWFDLAEDQFGMGGVWNNTYAPGEEHSYSNIATAYIASLVERLTNKSFIDFCKEYVFDPVGMTHTAWFRRDLPEGTREAMPVYTTNTEGVFEDVGHYCFADFANGQLHSTIRDMAAYADALLDYGVGTLWTEATAQSHVFGCQEKDESGELLPDEDCSNSLMWFYLHNDLRPEDGPLSTIDFTNGIEHSGGEAGIASNMVVFPEANTYVIVLTNTEDADIDYLSEVVLEYGLELLATANEVEGGGSDVDDDDDDDVDDDDGNGDDDADVATEKSGGERVLRGTILDMINKFQ